MDRKNTACYNPCIEQRGGSIMIIRHASVEDLKAVAELEAICFPPAEAATEEQLYQRILHYGDHFWLLFEDDRLIAFADGFVSSQRDLTDEMYAHAELHEENGAWQMIFGINTHPEFRKMHYASRLMETVIQESRLAHRSGLVLTCKESLIPFYQRFGFQDEGISTSIHGGVQWHQMRLSLTGNQLPMRRTDRQVTDQAELEEIIRNGKIVHLGLIDTDCPYVVPMHYGYEFTHGVWTLYLHCAKSGHKIDLVRRNPVCFAEIDSEMELISGGDNPCSYGASYASVMGKGKVQILENTGEKIHGLEVLMRHQTGRTFQIDAAAADHVSVLKITLPQITGKRRKKPGVM